MYFFLNIIKNQSSDCSKAIKNRIYDVLNIAVIIKKK